MKCLHLISVFLLLLLSNVCSLELIIKSQSTVNTETPVTWNRQSSDPDPLIFDLRFVNSSGFDVGLAAANVQPPLGITSGNMSVAFSVAGNYRLVAVYGRPNYVQIGASNLTQVVNVTVCRPEADNPSAPQPSSMSQPSLSPAPSATRAISSTPERRNVNVPAVVGGTISAIVFIAVIFFMAFLFLRRRRLVQDARISFHRDMMVRRTPDKLGPSVSRSKDPGTHPYPFTIPGSSFGSIGSDRPPSVDLERGLSEPTEAGRQIPATTPPLRPGHIVLPPRGPRDRKDSRPEVALSVDVEGPDSAVGDGVVPPTPRQRQVMDKIANVDAEIEELEAEKKPGPSAIVKLDDLKRQKSWLVRQQGSMWALGKLDTNPPGYSRYLS